MAWTIAAVGAVYVATFALLPHRAFWINDGGSKYLQVRAILASGYSDFALRWPGRDVDPTFVFNPLPGQFSHVVDGKLYSQYPPAFAAVTAPFFQAFGFPGLFVLPLLATVLALVGVERLARDLELGRMGRRAAVAIAGLATPLWFYAVVFWEPALVVCACVWATHAMLRLLRGGRARHAALTGLLAGMGAWFREEVVLFGALLVALVFVATPGRRLRSAGLVAVAFAAALLPLLAFQRWALGSALGFHAQGNFHGLGAFLVERPAVFYVLLVAADPSTWISVAITAPFVVALFRNPKVSRAAFPLVVPGVAVVAAVAGLAALRGFADAKSPIAHLLASNSLFPAAPIVLLGLVRPDEPSGPAARARRWLWLVCAAYAGAYALAAPSLGSVVGIQWGSRFLLVLYPLLAVLAAATLDAWVAVPRRRPVWAWVAVASVVLVSLLAQSVSIDLLRRRTEWSARLQQVLDARPEPVIATDVWWAPQEMFSRFPTTPIFYVPSPRDLPQLFARLPPAVDRVLFVSHGGPANAIHVDDDGLGYFTLALWPIAVTHGAGG